MTNSAILPRYEVEAIASRVLDENPGEVVRLRLLREGLNLDPSDPALIQARQELSKSQQIRMLVGEQQTDGSWGQFHSRDSTSKQKIITTEVGVERALALGLDAAHPALSNAARYIINVMEGRLEFPDRHEKNDRWSLGMRLFLASTFSRIHPHHAALEQDRRLWLEITQRTFQSGNYDAADEIRAHAALTGARVKDSNLVLDNRYTFNILGSVEGMLSTELERILLGWLWNRPEGIMYLGVPLNEDPPVHAPGQFDRWLASLEMLARLFPQWIHVAGDALDWIWSQKNEEGYWDFGPRPNYLSYMPLSDNWRKQNNRVFDWTTRILVLLARA